MPCLRLPKKLLPSKKACKSFISTLTTRLRPFFPRRTTTNSRVIHHMRRRQQHTASATIYVDRLFPANAPRPAPVTPAVAVTSHVETGTSSGGGKGAARGKWKEYLESLPPVPVRGVDERAEEFIADFRRQMTIQREQSLLEFQEMLARSI